MVRAAVERAGEGVTFSRAERVKNRVAQYLARELGSCVYWEPRWIVEQLTLLENGNPQAEIQIGSSVS